MTENSATDSAPAASPPDGGGDTSAPATLSESIRDELNVQFDAAEAAEADDTPSAEAPETRTDAPPAADTGVSAEGVEVLVDESGSATAPSDPVHSGPGGPTSPPSTSDQWTPEQRAVFDAMPADDRAVMESWAAELQGGLTPKLQEAAGLRRALDPIQADISDSGLSPTDVIGQLVSHYQGLSQDPLGTVVRLLSRDTVAGPLAGTEQATQAVAQIAKALKVTLGTADEDPWQADDGASSKRIDGLEQELRALRDERNQDRHAAGKQAMAQAGDTLQEFQQAKTNGQLTNPHFSGKDRDKIAGTMAGLIKAGMAKGLPDAYTKAVGMEGLATAAAPKATPAARAKRAATPRGNGAGPTAREPDPIAEITHPDPNMQRRLRMRAELGRNIDAANEASGTRL